MRNESSDMTKKKHREEVFWLGKQAEEAGDYDAAAMKYQEAVDLKYVPAELALGKLYYFGAGVPQDYEKAHLYLQRAREKIKNREKTAEALYYLAQLFRHGLGVDQSSMRAHNRLQLAAKLGNSDAMCMLGEMFENGECAWNKSRRLREEYWYREAAYAGNTQAMHRLIQLYKNGECGVQKDDAEAEYWSEQVDAAEKKNRVDLDKIMHDDVLEI